jgi:two-component system sensor histidine kinase CpxA
LKSQIQAKEILLRDISHELRSPLARIQIALGLAALERSNVEVQHRRIERDIERMNTLIEEIIRLARLSNAPQSFHMEEVDLGLLLDEIADDVASEAKMFGGRVVLKRPSNLTLWGQPEMLRRGIENVLRNAVRFSPDGADIDIAAEENNGTVRICIRDRGPGVPEADLELIFEPFYRVSLARERDGGGTGLGLAITTRVMSLHDGNVSARNHDDGGLVITLILPGLVASKDGSSTPARYVAVPPAGASVELHPSTPV